MQRRVLLLALVLDLLFGDPPNRLHPVAWMGRFIGWLQKRITVRGRILPFISGAGITLSGAVVFGGAAWILSRTLRWLPGGWILSAVLLKLTFSLRGLNDAAHTVEAALQNDDLAEARRLASWHLVSRDTSALTASQVAAAAVESVAENTSDGVIAPLFFYALGGLPGAYAYRYVQTCDSMLGYRDAQHEWSGKFPARLDDLLNLLPSRVTALLFVVTAPLVEGNAGKAWRIWQRDGNLTASPNAGQPMSAAAGALGVELEKVGHYTLGEGLRQPSPADISRARRLMIAASLLFVGLLTMIARGRHDD
ncbi:MAG: cobalamin biosynthesis protein [Chloroflexota bacterium]